MFKRFILPLFLLLSLCLNTQAQEPSFAWARSMGGSSTDIGIDVVVDPAGNVITVGSFTLSSVDFDPGGGVFMMSTGNGATDGFVQKLSPTGSFLWAIQIGAVTSQGDVATGVDVDDAGNVYVTGYFGGTVDFDPGAGVTNVTSVGTSDAFVLKLNPNGGLIWVKTFGGISSEIPNKIVVDSTGNILVSGYFTATADFDPNAGVTNLVSAGSADAFITKLDPAGNLLWARGIGGAGFDSGGNVVVDELGNAYLAGGYQGTVDLDPGPGVTNVNNGASGVNTFIIKFDSFGNFILGKALQSISGSSQVIAGDIAIDAAKNIYLAGDFYYTVDFDPSAGIYPLTEGSSGSSDAYVLKLNANGEFVYVRQVGTNSSSQTASALVLDAAGNIYYGGTHNGVTDFDPGLGTFNSPSTSAGNDCYVSKLDNNGIFGWVVFFGASSSSEVYNDLDIDPAGNLYSTGTFQSLVDFDPGPAIFSLLTVAGQDIWIQKLSPTCTNPSTPTITASSNSICTAGSTTLSIASGSLNSATQWEWYSGSCGGTLVGTGSSISVSPASTTTYFVRGAGGCVSGGSCQSITVTVSSVAPAQPGSISGGTAVCQGSANSYSVAAVPGASTYTWTLPGGWTGTSTTNTITALAGATGGTISVIASNACGPSTSQSITVTVSPAPVQPGALSGNLTVCQGTANTYSVAVVPGASSYSWSIPGGWSGTSASNSIVATAGATGGTISVTANNSCGPSAPSSISVTASAPPGQPGAVSGSISLCSGSTNTYSVVNDLSASSYNWTLPSGWSGSSASNSISTGAGTSGGTIQVSASNSCGTSPLQSLVVTVNATPSQPGAIAGSTTVCQGTAGTYTVSAIPGATAYNWTLPAGWSGSSTSNTITATSGSAGGAISVTASNSCGTSAAQALSVSVNSTPAQPASISGNTSICAGSSNTYSIAAVGGATGYTWVLPSGWSGNSTTNSITASASTSSGLVSVSANNSCGSSSAQTVSVTVNAAPAQPGTITGNATVCSGSANTYSINPVAGATSYTWTLPGGWAGTSSTNTISTTAGGAGGTLSVVANNACGTSTAQSISISLNSTPAQPATISGSSSACAGATITYSVANDPFATSYTWTLPGGWTGSSTTNSISATAGGTGGTVSVIANNACGASSTRTLAVTIASIPAQPGTITGSTSICQGSVNSYSIATVAGASSYTWTLPGGWTGTSTSNSISTTASGSSGTISVSANNTCGTSSTQTLSVTVNTVPAQPGTITGGTTVCQTSANTYTVVNDAGATSYTWSLPAGWAGSSSTNSIATTAGSAGGTIAVSANNGCGSSTAQSLVVGVNGIPAQPATISGNTSLCQGSSNPYSITAVPGATSYTWTLPGGFTGSSSSNSINTIAGAVGGNITVTANNVCGVSTAQTLAVAVTVAPPQPGAISGNATLCQGASNTYSIAAVPGALSYTWTLPGTWTGTSTSNSITVTAGATGGTISVLANNACGNSTPQTLAVAVNSLPAQPGSITGNSVVCQTSANTFSVVNDPGASGYTWTLPAGWSGSSTTNTITTTAGSTGGTISVSANNSCGSSSPQTLATTVNSIPSQPGTITGNNAICQGAASSYSITAVPGATSYAWILPSGWSGTSSSNSINAVAGSSSGNITVTANNTCGPSAQQILSVAVTAIPLAPGTIAGNAAVCQGSSNTYSIAAIAGATSYTWGLPAGWTGSSTTNTITTTAGNAGGSITVFASNACGSSSTQNLSVALTTVPAQPSAISGATTVCQTAANTYAVVNDVSASSYSWTLPSGWAGSSSTNSIATTSGGTGGTITVVANNACGASSPQTLSITVNSIPVQPGTIAGGAAVCQGSSNTYNISSIPGATSYTWTLPGGWTGISSSNSINAIASGSSGNISVTANNACGNSTPQALAVAVTALPTQPGAIAGNATVCQGASGTYSITAVPGAASYTWTLPVGWTGSSAGNSITATAGANSGTITVTADNACGASTAQTFAVVVNSLPAQPGTISGATAVCQSATVTYSVTNNPGASSYTWLLPAGWSGSSTTNTITATVGSTGGTISVIANNACGGSTPQTLTTTVGTVPAQASAITGPASVCQGSANTYSIPAVVGATSYTWTLPSGWSGSSSTSTISTVAGSTSGNITVTANNSCGASLVQTTAISVTAIPATPGTVSGNTAVCQGSINVYSIGAVAGATSYTWSMPGGWTGTSTINTITTTAGNTGGNISVVANNSCGSSTAATLAVTLTTVPAQPSSINGNPSVCQTAANTFSVVNDPTVSSYTWTLPAGWAGSSTTNSISATSGGTGGTISVVANNSCGVSAAQTLVTTVGSLPAQPSPLTGATNACAGASETYTVTPVLGATSYTWVMPNGWTGSSTTTSIVATVGTSSGNISVTANNACGSSNPQVLAVVVDAVPNIPSAISGPNSSCQGISVTYSVPAVPGALSYTWTLPSGWTGTSTSNTITTTAGATSGTVLVSADNACGSSPDQSLVVTISPLPVQPLPISGGTTVCQSSNNTYTVAPVAGATSYNWTLPAGWLGSSNTNSIAITSGSAGGSLSVTASNACGTSPSQSISVSVINIPTQPSAIAGNAAACESTTNTYTVLNDPAASSYTWTLPSGWSGSSSTNSLTATAGNSGGTLLVTANNTCGSSSSQSFSITVDPLPGAPGAISGDLAVCDGTTNTYSIIPVTNASSYTWILPSGWSGSSLTNTISATAGTAGGSIFVSTSNVCGSSPASLLTVGMDLQPVSAFNSSGTQAQLIFTDLSTQSPTQWQWNFGDGTSSNLQNPTHVYTQAGNYVVCLTVSNSCGSNMSCQNLNVVVGMEDSLSFTDIDIFPNPNAGQFTLVFQTNSGKPLNLCLRNILGQPVWTKDLSPRQGTNTIPVEPSAIPAGSYYLVMTQGSKTVAEQVVVQ